MAYSRNKENPVCFCDMLSAIGHILFFPAIGHRRLFPAISYQLFSPAIRHTLSAIRSYPQRDTSHGLRVPLPR